MDVVGGFQPLKNEDASLVLVCNGEIYNHLELRSCLQQKGHRFQTGSDAEVILHLYEEKGTGLLEDLSGMFAFALWDRDRKQLLLARDRAGIKPMYYYADKNQLVFSSEMSPLIREMNLAPDLLDEKIWEFLSYGFPVHNEQTIHRKIKRLAPGQACLISESERQFFSYWRPAYLGPDRDAAPVLMDRVKNLFTAAVNSHLYSEVPTGLMLSGGLDSAAIASFGRTLGYHPETITIGYAQQTPGDERLKAHRIARLCGLSTNEVVLDYNAYTKAFNDLMAYCDEPVADIAAIPQWEVFKKARALGLKVLLNGLGGDEIFYGYPVWNEACQLFLDKTYPGYFDEDDVSGFFHHPAYRAARKFLDKGATHFFRESGIDADTQFFRRFEGPDLKGADRIYNLLFKTWLPNNCLLLADRLSMAHAIEVRVPLLDHRLVDYIQGLPHHSRYFGRQGKVILKKMLAPMLPQEIISMPKQGFTPPGNYMKDMVFSKKEFIFDHPIFRHLFRQDRIEVLWAEPEYLEIWFRLLVLGTWYNNMIREN